MEYGDNGRVNRGKIPRKPGFLPVRDASMRPLLPACEAVFEKQGPAQSACRDCPAAPKGVVCRADPAR
ncbi:hypothetical protein [Oxalobacter paraformigenes]|uniref:hypothetical protein n=1 Tax=Oxalobacter paraformigenes TaxID=556268 RepID=UPI0011CCDC82|nr:hypothetical protein [Oxalobacter paraformigenes]